MSGTSDIIYDRRIGYLQWPVSRIGSLHGKSSKSKGAKGLLASECETDYAVASVAAAKVAAYFIKLNRSKKQDATKDWRHAPIKQLRKEVGPATTSEQIDSALKELSSIGALEADPKLGAQLSTKEKRKGRSYRLHHPGQHAYKVKPKTTRRVTRAKQAPKPIPAGAP